MFLSLFFVCVLSSAFSPSLRLLSCLLCPLASVFFLHSSVFALASAAALDLRVFSVQLTNFRFAVTKVSSEIHKGHSRQVGMSDKLGSLFCVVKKQWDNFRPESKLYYYRGHEPEKKKIPPQGTPMRHAMTSFR